MASDSLHSNSYLFGILTLENYHNTTKNRPDPSLISQPDSDTDRKKNSTMRQSESFKKLSTRIYRLFSRIRNVLQRGYYGLVYQIQYTSPSFLFPSSLLQTPAPLPLPLQSQPVDQRRTLSLFTPTTTKLRNSMKSPKQPTASLSNFSVPQSTTYSPLPWLINTLAILASQSSIFSSTSLTNILKSTM